MYQPPPPCPANYIPRLEIINEVSKVIVDDSSDENSTVCIGTTVTIRGIGGIGKSTLAKALCYHPSVKKCFIHGFIWISLTPPRLSPEAILRDVYNKLTNNSVTCSYPLVKDRIRLFFSNFPCKLLVIFDDVVNAKDVGEYVEVFSSCKTILTTRKNDINITIPSKKCFDIGPMNAFEAVQLLTWQIPQLATLSANDADKIQELAKDLYYWPLLLSLVRGQLCIHIAWKQSSTTAILNVRQKLQDKGLTAFDPQYINKENAVKASINTSLELLYNNEKYVLFHIVSGIGIGTCVLQACVLKFSKVSSEEFDKVLKNLWSHGLINVGEIMLPSKTVAHSCIEVHDVIAQYIIEEMPYDYHVFLTETNIVDFGDHFVSIMGSNDLEIDVTNVKTDAVIMIDVLIIPFIIRTLAVFTRAKQIEFSKDLNSLIERNGNILKTNAIINFLKRKQPLAQIYGFIKENCRKMQSLLLDNKYDEAIAWLAEYVDNHPLIVLLESILTLKKELTIECKHNPELVKLINETFGMYDWNRKGIGNIISSLIYGRKLILEMIEAGARNEEIIETWEQLFYMDIDS